MAIAVVLYGAPVPRLSEELYLPLVRHTGDAAYLAGDWTMRGPFGEHWVFDHLFGPIAAAVPLVWFGWIGRLVTWSVLAVLLVRLGRRFGLSPALAGVGVALWLVANQSLIGSDWMFGTFEAKTVADCLLVGALLAATSDRVALAVVGLGLAVSFHPGIGGWGALSAGLALLVVPETRRRALRWAPVGVVLAAPGVVAIVTTIGVSSAALQRFVVLHAIPQHADPFFGGAQHPTAQLVVRAVVLAGMLGANIFWYRRAERTPAMHFLIAFQVAAMATVPVAFVARGLHLWSFLMLQPLRLGPLVVPLFFFFALVQRVRRLAAAEPLGLRPWRRRSVALLTAGALLALVVTSPLIAAPRMVERTLKSWTENDDDADAFAWIRDHTSTRTRCVVPVDRQDVYIRAERPIVANWQAIRYDALGEWKQRVDALVGGPAAFVPAPTELPALRKDYDRLRPDQIVAIAHHYGAGCIVASTQYPLPLLHRSGTVRIYRTPGAGTP